MKFPSSTYLIPKVRMRESQNYWLPAFFSLWHCCQSSSLCVEIIGMPWTWPSSSHPRFSFPKKGYCFSHSLFALAFKTGVNISYFLSQNRGTSNTVLIWFSWPQNCGCATFLYISNTQTLESPMSYENMTGCARRHHLHWTAIELLISLTSLRVLQWALDCDAHGGLCAGLRISQPHRAWPRSFMLSAEI